LIFLVLLLPYIDLDVLPEEPNGDVIVVIGAGAGGDLVIVASKNVWRTFSRSSNSSRGHLSGLR
jgi:hypothetical protein